MTAARAPELAAAYAFCRGVAKREAKNFYWAFRVLPRHKSDAMCAVYAFMRKADDLADDEAMSIEERRAAMAAWTAAWRQSREERTAEPLFVAVNDVQRRFGISNDLLEQLVAGTTMDLQSQPAGVVAIEGSATPGEETSPRTYQVYESFDALYRYCYLVASVVGLVTIRIFGYQGAEAEELAEHTGVAFQLTNILRDVREDAERGRVYLPMDELARGGVPVEQFARATQRAAVSQEVVSPQIRAVLTAEIERAQRYYASGAALIPLIDRDAQPAMRVLVSIYHRLLERIAADPAAVFERRVSVPTGEKLAILGRGLVGSLVARVL